MKATNRIRACEWSTERTEIGGVVPPRTIWQRLHTNHVMWVNRAGCCNPQDITSLYSRCDINARPGPTCAARANYLTDRKCNTSWRQMINTNQYSYQTPATAAFARIHTARGRYICSMEPIWRTNRTVRGYRCRFSHNETVFAPLLQDPEDHKTTGQRYSQDLTLISSNKLNHFP